MNTKKIQTKVIKKSPLVNAMEDSTNLTLTENQALTLKSSKSGLTDWFAQAGAMRTRSDEDIFQMFIGAFSEDRLLAIKSLFYFRDIRGGQGERRVFRSVLRQLAEVEPKILEKNLENIPFYGRWDDLFVLIGTSLHTKVSDFIRSQLEKDMNSESPSLLAKWMPSINTSSEKTRFLAKQITSDWGWTDKQYRKTLAMLRSKLKVLEINLANRDYTFQYDHVPSKAMFKYRKAFSKNDKDRYTSFLTKVKTGEKQIKSDTLYPYDIVRPILKSMAGLSASEKEQLDLQWRALPNYLEGVDNASALVICDVSGSMFPEAICVSTSIALYFAERNKGPFANCFVEFSSGSNLVKIKGETLFEKIVNIAQGEWGMSTNISAALEMILNTAVKNNIKPLDMPNMLLIISDMEFDSCGQMTNFENIKTKYSSSGYEMPEIVFWNVQARNRQVPVTYNEKGVALVSGSSPSIAKMLLSKRIANPYQLMLDTLNVERYDRVII